MLINLSKFSTMNIKVTSKGNEVAAVESSGFSVKVIFTIFNSELRLMFSSQTKAQYIKWEV